MVLVTSKSHNKIMKRFEDKVVIITGGASGLGAATAEAFFEEGAKIVIADFNEETGNRFVSQMTAKGYDSIFVKTDVCSEKDVEDLIAKTVEKYGKLDVMFANAGIARDAIMAELPKKTWDWTLDVNLTGVFLCNKHAIIQMLKQDGGVIVNTASVHALVGQLNMTAYAAAKGGVRLLTSTGALNYAKDNIRINAVCPGYVDTPLLSIGTGRPDGMAESQKEWLKSLHPLGRMGTPQEVANVVLFLASDDASFVSGSYLTVDGGYACI